MQLDRRSLLIGGGIGVGLLVAWQLLPGDDARVPVPEGGTAIGGMVALDPQGGITLHSPQVEYGQGIWTAFAQAIADEMGARMDSIAVQPLQAGSGFANPMIDEAFGSAIRITAAATSVRAFTLDIRRAAASMRELLRAEAAERVGLDPAGLLIAEGEVRGGERPLSFAELAEGAASRRARGAELRSWAGGGIIGTNAARVDTPPKMRGTFAFAADVRLPDMAYAAVRVPPPGGRVTGLDRAAASARQGTTEIIEDERFVAVIGETSWAAQAGLAAAKVRVTGARLDDAAIEAALVAALDAKDGKVWVDVGDASDAIAAADAPLAGEFRAAPMLHQSLEAPAAVARPRTDGGLDVWAATRAPDATRAAIADACGLSPSRIQLVPMGVGDPSGALLENDAAPVAGRLALRLGRPVQASLSHHAARRVGAVSPPMAARVEVALGGGGILGWRAHYAAPAGLGGSLARLGGKRGPSRLGATGLPYGVPAQEITTTTIDLPLRTGWMRGAEEAFHALATETMIDRAARALGRDPLSFRIGLLGGDVRMARLLTRLAAEARWDGGGAGSMMGVACARMDGSRIALVAEASGSPASFKVSRLVAAVDCGAMVNPALVEQQVAGGMLAALQQLRFPAPRIVDGLPEPAGAAIGPALDALPEIRVLTTPSGELPGGVSSLGAAIAPAAIANALGAGGEDQGPVLRTLPFALGA
ncbi:molybdopterin cofactor-binding domain-containing protein [Sphingomicrobium arenosum]|uniref:molybdopterin cofactor-binding domain-containing protein n=1 Tax=Sphingomicrobium arenosum TaxID=2233861 RepID=UPI002240FB5E|nr:molybdopterin cofactor-binding domain-containing protein [Sphingomicrobium arenosum]